MKFAGQGKRSIELLIYAVLMHLWRFFASQKFIIRKCKLAVCRDISVSLKWSYIVYRQLVDLFELSKQFYSIIFSLTLLAKWN